MYTCEIVCRVTLAYICAACKYFFGNMETTWKAGLLGKHESRQLRRIKIIRLCGGFFYSISLFIQNFHHDIAKCFCGF